MVPQPLPVTVSSSDADNPPVLDRIRELARSSTHALDPGFASENTSNQKSTTLTTPDVILRGAGEFSNAYLLLKSAAKCLSSILDNCEVRFPSRAFSPQYLQLC